MPDAPSARSLPARLLRSSAEWLGVLVFSLLLLEGCSRFVLGIEPLTTESLVWIHDERRGWSHRPDAEDTFVKAGFEQHVRINSAGLREREIRFEKPPGVKRILVIGDSSVVGFEVPPETVFTRILENVLNERGRRVEVINGGFRGYGTDQALLFLQDEGLRYQPDLVLYKWSSNDRYDNATIHRPFRKFGKPYFDLGQDGSLVLGGVPVPVYPYASNIRVAEDGSIAELPVSRRTAAILWLRDEVICRSSFATALTKVALALPAAAGSVVRMGGYKDGVDLPTGLDRDSRIFRVTLEMIREMQRSSEAAGARFGFIFTYDDLSIALRESAGLRDIGDHKLFTQRRPEGVSLQVPSDPHWNELGHELYGTSLADALEASGLLDDTDSDSSRLEQREEAEPEWRRERTH